MRELSRNFFNDLKSGILLPIFKYVKSDSTIFLEIRDGFINLYYRGGNLLKISEKADGYKIAFDTNYFLDKSTNEYINIKNLFLNLKNVNNNNNFIPDLIANIPILKSEMDKWFTKKTKLEREIQQILVKENNINLCQKSDYFIIDIEYTYKNDNGIYARFDAVGVKWESDGVSRKRTKNLQLSFIELKFMDSTLKNSSGILKHIMDINDFCSDNKKISCVKNEMKNIFAIKSELGCIENQNKIESFSEEKPELILILANHDPDSNILKELLEQIIINNDTISLKNIENYQNKKLFIDIKIATSNFFGYGLYKESIYSLDDFRKKFYSQIYNK
ncbi:MAG: hypothetical protein H7A30_06550 [Thermotogae bacterium]|nr:hypothetical protein [Thermotogota bacterium]